MCIKFERMLKKWGMSLLNIKMWGHAILQRLPSFPETPILWFEDLRAGVVSASSKSKRAALLYNFGYAGNNSAVSAFQKIERTIRDEAFVL